MPRARTQTLAAIIGLREKPNTDHPMVYTKVAQSAKKPTLGSDFVSFALV